MNVNLRHDEYHVEPQSLSQTVNGAKLIDLGDKGIVVEYPAKQVISPGSGSHDENLIYKLDGLGGVADALGSHLVEAIQDDINSRTEWETGLKFGIEQLGIKPEKGREKYLFEGASSVYSPAFMQAYLSSISNISAELLPPDGPAKIKIEGEENDESVDRAFRVEKWINFYLTEICKEFYPDMEQAISWLVLYGSVFTKTYQDPILLRPIPQYIKPQDFVVNYNASSLNNCNRITHILHLTKKELKQRQYNGLYRDIELFPDDDGTDMSLVTEKVQQQEGVTPGEQEYNEIYTIYECHVDLDLEGYEHKDQKGNPTGIPLPYIVTIDSETQKILSIYKNWKEGDKNYKRIEYFTHFSYFPGLGFYGYGLTHIAGGSAKAATGILRQLIDAGILSNFPGGFRAKGVKAEDNTFRIGPGQYPELDVSGMTSIQNAIYPLPFKEPSLVLKDLKVEIEEGIGRMVSAAETQFADFNPNAPVGTTLALLEQSNKLQSSVMRRLHRSMGDMFAILYRLFKEYMSNETYPYMGNKSKHNVIGSDFREDLKIIPVSDPNIVSSAHRLIRWEAVNNLADANPDLMNKRVIIKDMLMEMKVPNIDSILPPEEEEEIKPTDPISENGNLINGQPVKAFVFQDHKAHMTIHSLLEQHPMIQNDPEKLQAVKAHISEHNAFDHMLLLQQMTGIQLPENPEELSPEEQNQIAIAASSVAQDLLAQLQQQQQGPMDAAMLEAQALMEEVKVKDKEVELTAQVNMQRIEIERLKIEQENMRMEQQAKIDEQRLMIDQLKFEKELEGQEIKLAVEERKIEQQAKNEELKAETAAYEAQLKYETEQDKIKAKKEEVLINLNNDEKTEEILE